MFSERLKQQRMKKGLSQSELARRVGVGRDSYNKYERSGTNPSHETLVLLATELDTTVDFLLGKTDDPNRNARPMRELSPNEMIRIGLFGDVGAEIGDNVIEDIKEYAAFKADQEKRNSRQTKAQRMGKPLRASGAPASPEDAVDPAIEAELESYRRELETKKAAATSAASPDVKGA